MLNKICLITGGSSGLGLAFAQQLARNYAVILVARDVNRITKAVSMLKNQGYEAYGFSADIRCEKDLMILKETIHKRFKRIDFLILNAGVVHPGSLLESNSEQIMQDISTNLLGTILCAKYFEDLLRCGQSKVLFISSALGLLGLAGYPAYCAAKAGVINFAAAWRRELLIRKINIYVACPADIDTPQYQRESRDMPHWMPLKNRGKAQPVAEAASKILKKCTGKQFIIIIDFSIWLFIFLNRLLPQRLINFILDCIFPRPRYLTIE